MSLLDDTNFENCTKCTICTEYCPVSMHNPLYPGPKQSGPDGERLRLKDPEFYDEALKYCTNCKRCEVVCPSDVKIGDVIQLARKRYNKKLPLLRDAMLSHTDLMGGLAASPLAPLVNKITALGPFKTVLDKVLRIPAQRRLPQYASGTFRRWFTRSVAPRQAAFTRQVAMFHGCYINYNNPELGKDVVAVLNAFGVGVNLLSRERCCGVPLIAGRFFKQAKKNALRNCASLSEAVEKGLRVIVPSSTCTMTLRNEYPHILEVDNSGWRSQVDLLSRYIHRLWDAGETIPLKPLKLKVAYHTACHLERIGWASYSLELLKRIPGLEVVTLPSQCCGIAGTYGFKGENYATAQNIGSSLFKAIEEAGVDLVVCDCETCKWQIEMSTSKQCEHPVTLLARALG